MPKRGEAVHVATTQRKYKGKVYTSHLLRRTYREDGKVKHQTLGNLSHLPLPVIEMIRMALKGETLVPANEAFQIERSLPHGHVAAVLGTLRRLGLDRIISSRRSRERDLVVAMIVARILDPRSKLATARGFDETSSLKEVLGLEDVSAEDLYLAMDWLLKQQGRIESKLAREHLEDGCLVLYDVTSTYFEGRCCPLAKIGYSRDRKKDTLQIVFGLMTDAEGRPISVEVFEGNTGDPSTLPAQVAKLKKRFGLKKVVIVGDRGMITAARIMEDLEPESDLRWITALRAPAIKKLAEGGLLQMSLFDEKDLAEISHPDYPNERLIICLNPLLKAERERKREELLQATERELDKIIVACQRHLRPLHGKDKIGLRVGRVLGRFKMAKHFRLTITDDAVSYQRDEERISAEAALDGIYIIRTNVPAREMAAEEAVLAYKNLSVAERAFRSLKTVDLKVRPIFHRLPDRVRAHVLLCMLAYYVEWHMKAALAPLLFQDEFPEAGKARRASVVAPAKRSEHADLKASTQKTTDGFDAHDFQSLLAALATLPKNTVKARAIGATFVQYTAPTPLQQRALDLLGVKLSM